MAIPPGEIDDTKTRNLLRDAEEDLRREQMAAWWKEWGMTVLGMAVMLVIGTAIGVGWRHWKQAQHEQSTARLMTAADNPATTVTPDQVKDLNDSQAAILYLVKAGMVGGTMDTGNDAERKAARDKVQVLFDGAAKAGGSSVWGWLGRWNALRLRSDAKQGNPESLIKAYDDLAQTRKDSALAALAWTDAAVVAGEWLGDPARALEYIAKAEHVTPQQAAMSGITADLKHLYQVQRMTAAGEKK